MAQSKQLAFPFNLWQLYLRALEKHPLATQCATSAAITYGGDFVAQTVFEKQKTVDYTRIGKFVLFTILITPLYNRWYKILGAIKLHKGQGPEPLYSVLIKLGLDQILWDPIITSSFFVYMAFIEGGGWREAKRKLARDYWITQKMSWRVWPLFNFIMLRYVPEELQILFGNVVAFAWNIYKSLIVMRA